MKLPVSRITLRLYIVGLVQAAFGVAAATAVVLFAFRAHPELDEHVLLNFPVDQLAYELESPATFEERGQTIARQLHMTFRVDARGRTWTFPAPEPVESCWSSPPTAPAEEADSNRTCIAREVMLADGSSASITVARRRLGLTLQQVAAMHAVIFAVGSILLGRSLVKPLRHMSEIARAFGRGDASARVRLQRGDELGDVARAFDEMADQVVDGRRAERELLANVSHELRTPLARIRLALEFASDAKAEVAFQSRKDIAEDLDELEVLLTDILTAARLEGDGGAPSGISPLRKEVIVVHELVSRAEARFRAAHPGRALRVRRDAPGHTIEVDPIQVRRAIDNLLANANTYSPDPDREIELRVDATDETVTISVVDHGIGISTDDQRLLFRPFFRADRSRSRKTGGLGLGLVLVRRIAEAHGGTVTLASELGRGTEVRIELPA